MIQTSQLVYQFANGPQLRFPDVDVPQGGVLLLRGPSGSGKSTLLALAAALLRPSGGQITVAGQDLTALKSAAGDEWRSRAIGFLPQKLHLSEALTVAGNLALAQWAAGVPDDPDTIAQVLETVGLSDLAKRKPGQLSGGQAQRVALGRAVLLSPQVILVDEPTASLDDDAAHAALELLLSTAQRCHATLVVATHDARVKQALALAIDCQIGTLPPSNMDM